jgi:hypothetical protein
MSARASQLHHTARGQLTELTDLLANVDEQALRLPCPGREKLGTGTIGAVALHATTAIRTALA